jgi:hypothetical protein
MSDRVHIIGHFVPNAVLRTIKHSPDTLIECHAAAAAVLRMNNAKSHVALEVVPIMRGEKGDMPAHTWNGTSLSIEMPSGGFGISVDLKGEKGDIGTSDWDDLTNKPPLTHRQDFLNTNLIYVSHGMRKNPAVFIEDTGGSQWIPKKINHLSLNDMSIEFDTVLSGTVFLS